MEEIFWEVQNGPNIYLKWLSHLSSHLEILLSLGGGIRTCSSLAEDPNPFKARGRGRRPHALFAFGSEANAEHA